MIKTNRKILPEELPFIKSSKIHLHLCLYNYLLKCSEIRFIVKIIVKLYIELFLKGTKNLKMLNLIYFLFLILHHTYSLT